VKQIIQRLGGEIGFATRRRPEPFFFVELPGLQQIDVGASRNEGGHDVVSHLHATTSRISAGSALSLRPSIPSSVCEAARSGEEASWPPRSGRRT